MVTWLPPDWPKTIVALQVERRDNEGRLSYSTIGTGFLIAYSDISVMFTAKHVVVEDPNNLESAPRRDVFLAFNAIDGKIERISTATLIDSKVAWFNHPGGKDISCCFVPFDLKKHVVKHFAYEMLVDMSEVEEGLDVFFLGFPLGITAPNKITPVIRSGMVALNQEGELLIDANVFPGNSGSPVFIRPSILMYGGKEVPGGKIMGIISEALTYTDMAVSQQTRRARISFEENAGLGRVLPASMMSELVQSGDFKKKFEDLKESEKKAPVSQGGN